jgi:hypothetical protein
MAKVSVGCKLPNGLKISVGTVSVTLNGTNSARVIGGHGITEGVDGDFFDAWLKANKDRDVVKNSFVFAQTSTKKAEDEAKEKKDEKTGLDPLNPNDPKNGVKTAAKD